MNRADRVIAFLEKWPDVWIEAVNFESVGGRQAWRTAISEARQIVKADGRDIVNRTRQMSHKGQEWTLSEYKLVSPPVEGETGAETRGHDMNASQPGSLF